MIVSFVNLYVFVLFVTYIYIYIYIYKLQPGSLGDADGVRVILLLSTMNMTTSNTICK